MSVECEKYEECKTKECIVIDGFLETYNIHNKTHYQRSSCPDKDATKGKGRKPDGVAEDKETAEKMVIEVKQIYHSEAKDKGDILWTKEKNRNYLHGIISYRMDEIINLNDLDDKFIVTITVYNKIGSNYMEKITSLEFVKMMEQEILSKRAFEYEDEKIKIQIQENYLGTDWLDEERQVLFCFPVCQERGKEDGMSFKELFDMIEDYDSIVTNIETYIEKKCVGKFNNYIGAKRIILFELKLKYGMEIMLEVNDMDCNMGFSFERLRNVYQKKVGKKLKEHADEVWIMHMEDKNEEESMIRMIELT